MAEGRASTGDTILRALAVGVIALALGALTFAVWIGLENLQRIGV